MGKHVVMSRRSHSAGGLGFIKRPKRNIAVKTYDDAVGLSRTEERDLKKALYASLQESKRIARYHQGSDVTAVCRISRSETELRSSRPLRSRSWPNVPSLSSTATTSASPSVDESSQDSIKSSISSLQDARMKQYKQERKIHAQRKFAQGALPPTPNTTPVKMKPSPVKLLPKTAKTEDFLTFLCLRGSSILPPHLDFFNFSRGEPPQGEISAPQTPQPSEEPSLKRNGRLRESTPESSSNSTNDELYDIGTPSPCSMTESRIVVNGINSRNGLSARKAARACASTPETARGIVSLSQGFKKKVTRVSSTRQKYGSLDRTPSPRKGSGFVRHQLSPSKRGFAVKSLSPQFTKTSPKKKLSLKKKSLSSFLPRKASCKSGNNRGTNANQLMQTKQVNNPVDSSHASSRRSVRLRNVHACGINRGCSYTAVSAESACIIPTVSSVVTSRCCNAFCCRRSCRSRSLQFTNSGDGCVQTNTLKIKSKRQKHSIKLWRQVVALDEMSLMVESRINMWKQMLNSLIKKASTKTKNIKMFALVPREEKIQNLQKAVDQLWVRALGKRISDGQENRIGLPFCHDTYSESTFMEAAPPVSPSHPHFGISEQTAEIRALEEFNDPVPGDRGTDKGLLTVPVDHETDKGLLTVARDHETDKGLLTNPRDHETDKSLLTIPRDCGTDKGLLTVARDHETDKGLLTDPRDHETDKGLLTVARDHETDKGLLTDPRDHETDKGLLTIPRDCGTDKGLLTVPRDHETDKGLLTVTRDHETDKGLLTDPRDHETDKGLLTVARDHETDKGLLTDSRDHETDKGLLTVTRDHETDKGLLTDPRDHETDKGLLTIPRDCGTDKGLLAVARDHETDKGLLTAARDHETDKGVLTVPMDRETDKSLLTVPRDHETDKGLLTVPRDCGTDKGLLTVPRDGDTDKGLLTVPRDHETDKGLLTVPRDYETDKGILTVPRDHKTDKSLLTVPRDCNTDQDLLTVPRDCDIEKDLLTVARDRGTDSGLRNVPRDCDTDSSLLAVSEMQPGLRSEEEGFDLSSTDDKRVLSSHPVEPLILVTTTANRNQADGCMWDEVCQSGATSDVDAINNQEDPISLMHSTSESVSDDSKPPEECTLSGSALPESSENSSPRNDTCVKKQSDMNMISEEPSSQDALIGCPEVEFLEELSTLSKVDDVCTNEKGLAKEVMMVGDGAKKASDLHLNNLKYCLQSDREFKTDVSTQCPQEEQKSRVWEVVVKIPPRQFIDRGQPLGQTLQLVTSDLDASSRLKSHQTVNEKGGNTLGNSFGNDRKPECTINGTKKTDTKRQTAEPNTEYISQISENPKMSHDVASVKTSQGDCTGEHAQQEQDISLIPRQCLGKDPADKVTQDHCEVKQHGGKMSQDLIFPELYSFCLQKPALSNVVHAAGSDCKLVDCLDNNCECIEKNTFVQEMELEKNSSTQIEISNLGSSSQMLAVADFAFENETFVEVDQTSGCSNVSKELSKDLENTNVYLTSSVSISPEDAKTSSKAVLRKCSQDIITVNKNEDMLEGVEDVTRVFITDAEGEQCEVLVSVPHKLKGQTFEPATVEAEQTKYLEFDENFVKDVNMLAHNFENSIKVNAWEKGVGVLSSESDDEKHTEKNGLRDFQGCGIVETANNQHYMDQGLHCCGGAEFTAAASAPETCTELSDRVKEDVNENQAGHKRSSASFVAGKGNPSLKKKKYKEMFETDVKFIFQNTKRRRKESRSGAISQTIVQPKKNTTIKKGKTVFQAATDCLGGKLSPLIFLDETSSEMPADASSWLETILQNTPMCQDLRSELTLVLLTDSTALTEFVGPVESQDQSEITFNLPKPLSEKFVRVEAPIHSESKIFKVSGQEEKDDVIKCRIIYRPEDEQEGKSKSSLEIKVSKNGELEHEFSSSGSYADNNRVRNQKICQGIVSLEYPNFNRISAHCSRGSNTSHDKCLGEPTSVSPSSSEKKDICDLLCSETLDASPGSTSPVDSPNSTGAQISKAVHQSKLTMSSVENITTLKGSGTCKTKATMCLSQMISTESASEQVPSSCSSEPTAGSPPKIHPLKLTNQRNLVTASCSAEQTGRACSRQLPTSEITDQNYTKLFERSLSVMKMCPEYRNINSSSVGLAGGLCPSTFQSSRSESTNTLLNKKCKTATKCSRQKDQVETCPVRACAEVVPLPAPPFSVQLCLEESASPTKKPLSIAMSDRASLANPRMPGRSLLPVPRSVMSCSMFESSHALHDSLHPGTSLGGSRSETGKSLRQKFKKKKDIIKRNLQAKRIKKKILLKTKFKSKKQAGRVEEHPRKKRIVRRSSLRLKELTKALKAKKKRRKIDTDQDLDFPVLSPSSSSKSSGKKRNFAPRHVADVTDMPRAVIEDFDFHMRTDDEDDEVSFGCIPHSLTVPHSDKKDPREKERPKKMSKKSKTRMHTRSSSQRSVSADIVAKKRLSAVKKLCNAKSNQFKLSKIIERRRKMRQEDEKEGAKRGRKPGGMRKPASPEKRRGSDSSWKSDLSGLKEVPTFHPTEEEFWDPIHYIESIREQAEPYGMCHIIPPPNWKCESRINEEMRFTAQVQLVHKLYKRWGSNVKFTASASRYLDSIGADLEPSPQIGGVEVDLCKLSQTIQEFGGMQNVVDKKKWVKIADAMKIPKLAQDRGLRLYDVYCKYLLPYDTLSAEEKQRVEQSVTAERHKKEKSVKPDDEEAIVKGKSNPLSTFVRVSRNVQSMWFKENPSPEQVETEYWKLLEERNHHVAVQCGHVSTSTQGSGFPSKREGQYAKHGWHLNNLSENPKCILRSLGPVSGATIPTLHICMLFATSCWCTDVHHLPYIQYLHTGSDIIWYSIPKQQENKFKTAMKELTPSLVSTHPRWLKEDTVMVNPSLLTARGVSVSRCVQKPKTFVAIFPKAYTATVSCGYNVSESVHYATRDWITTGMAVAEELNKSQEPELFSMEALLWHLVSDPTTDVQTLKVAVPYFEKVLSRELSLRKQLNDAGVKSTKQGDKVEESPSPSPSRKRSIDQVEENICDVSKKHCFLSKVVNSVDSLTFSLEDGLKHAQKKKSLKHFKVVCRYSEEELKSTLHSAQCRLDISGSNDGCSKKRGIKK